MVLCVVIRVCMNFIMATRWYVDELNYSYTHDTWFL